ncbi:unnamed protein product [Microthlaspi erraticum]|uniref:Uncharacterized protein n=1 Tax=Microthlaspi erraticum TaxID=1685480 RepID=A0A6D2IN65_9BRAS|nr:unnamed protein product [Microthlaspi erraticum]
MAFMAGKCLGSLGRKTKDEGRCPKYTAAPNASNQDILARTVCPSLLRNKVGGLRGVPGRLRSVHTQSTIYFIRVYEM